MYDIENRETQEAGPGIGKILFGIAAFGFLHKASSASLKYASQYLARSAGRLIRNFGSRELRGGFVGLQRTALAQARRTARVMGTGPVLSRDLSLGQLTRPLIQDGVGFLNSRSVMMRNISSASKQSFRQLKYERTKYFRSAGLRNQDLRRAIAGEFSPGDIDQRRLLTSKYFKHDGGFNKRFMGSASMWAYKYAKSVPGLYVADKALNLFGQENREPAPKWYDIPGHIGGMIKFGVTMAPMDLAFRGLGSGLKFGKDKVADFGRDFLAQRPGVRSSVERVLSQEGFAGQVRSYGKAFAKAYREKRREGWGISIQPIRFDPSPYNIKDMFQKAISYQKEIGKSTFGVEAEMKQILDMIDASKSNVKVRPELFESINSMGPDNPVTEAFDRLLSRHTRAPKKTMLQHMLGQKAKQKSTFEFIDEYASKAGWTSGEKDEIRSLLGDKKLYLGSNIFEQGDYRLWSGAYFAEKTIEGLGKLRVPGIGWAPFERTMMQRKTGSFEIIDNAILQASEVTNRGVDRVVAPRDGQVFLKVGDTMFVASPYNKTDPIRPMGPPAYKGRGKMLHLSSGEAAHLSSVEEIKDGKQAGAGWWSRFRGRFELGYDRGFFGSMINRWLRKDHNPYAPGAMFRTDNEAGRSFQRLVRGADKLNSENYDNFLEYMRVIETQLGQADDEAFKIISRHSNVRNKVLDILGVPDAARNFDDSHAEALLLELRHMANPRRGPVRNQFDEATSEKISRALSMFHSSKDNASLWKARASVIGASDNVTVGEYLRGEYFRKIMVQTRMDKGGDFLGQPNLTALEDIYKTVDDSLLSTREKVAMKAMVTGTSIDLSVSKLTSTGKGIAPIDFFNDYRKIISNHWSVLEDIMTKRIVGRQVFKTVATENGKVSLSMNAGKTDNRMWLFKGGNRNPFPGLINQFLNKANWDAPVTEASILTDRWFIRPFNRTMAHVGLDLTYRTNAEFAKKAFYMRALAIPAAIFGYKAIDTAVAAFPGFDHTILDDGLTVAGADVVAKLNLTRAGMFDSLGITGAAQYLEGLMPGSVESPAAKILRGAAPPVIGRHLGGLKGFYAGLAVSAMSGFGLPDLTRTKEELNDIYSGDELVPVRKGRFWELCVTKNALIRTPAGPKEAQYIEKGDIVFNSDGDPVTVDDISHRPLIANEKVLGLYTDVFTEDPMLCTSDHQILCRRHDMELWIKAGDLLIGDELVLPIRVFDNSLVHNEPNWKKEDLYGMGYLVGNFFANGELSWVCTKGKSDVAAEKNLQMHFSKFVGNAIDTAVWIEKLFEHEPEISISDSGEYTLSSVDESLLENFAQLETKKIPANFYHLGGDFRDGFICSIVKNSSDVDDRGRLHIILNRYDKTLSLFIMDAFISMGLIPSHHVRSVKVGEKVEKLDHIILSRSATKILKKKFKELNYKIPREKHTPEKKDKIHSVAYLEDGMMYHTISDIREITYTDDVYDFWVSTGESFCGIAGVYHNSKGPFAGGRITSWLPSWYTRIKSQYRYTDTALGTKMESLLYSGPLAAVGITDPYHYERCVIKGTMVYTDSGFQKVENIQIGDKVYTHEGTLKKVIGKEYQNIDEDIVSFYSIGFPSSTTAEHRYYVRSGGKVGWIRADQLSDRDYLLIPNMQFRNYHSVDLLKHFPGSRTDEEIIYRGNEAFPRHLKLSLRLGELFGIYISMHQYAKDPLSFKSKGDAVYEQRFKNCIKGCFGLDPDGVLKSVYFKKILDWFGKPENFRIPEELHLCNREFYQGFLRGIFQNRKMTWNLEDIRFVSEISKLLLMFGIYADVHQSSHLGFRFTNDQWDNLQRLFTYKLYNPISDDLVKFGEVFTELKIRKIQKEPYRGRIYDIEIDGAHSFHGDCCVYHNTRFNERPYPMTAPSFHNVPVLGPLMNATVGNITKPQMMMHEDEIEIAAMGSTGGGSYAAVMNRPASYEGAMSTKQKTRSSSLGYHASESFYRMTEAIGLRGFLTQTLMEQEGPGTFNPTLEDASSITSHAGMFWDLQLGGMFGLSEGIRRLYPRERSLNLVNPIRNTQPTWLPDELKFGDAIGRLDNGLLLLPSKAYEKTHSVKHNFPLALDYLGYDPRAGALRYTQQDKGDLVEVHHSGPLQKYVEARLAKENLLVSRGQAVFDPVNMIDGHVDAIVRMGDDTVPLQIKASTAEKIGSMSSPLDTHTSQINFLLRMLKKRTGQITYVAADNPEIQKTFSIEYNEQRLKRDLDAANQLRNIAMKMIQSGVGYAGESYSYSDRLMVLANVAPYSDEFKETLKKLNTLNRFHLLEQDDVDKMNRARRMRDSMMRQYDMYPRRFQIGKLMTPDKEYNLMAENKNIKAAAEYSLLERAIGSVWESFATTRIPFVSRFYGMRTPEQMYSDTVLSSTASMWSHPKRDFLDPAVTSFLSSDDPFEAARKGAIGGALFGPPGVAIGAAAGAIYGSVFSGEKYIPSDVTKRRKLDEYFSAIKYVKGMNLYEQTGDPSYLDMAKTTPFGINEGSSASDLYRSIPYKERPFFWTFAEVEDPGDRKRILQKVSPHMGSVLQFMWNQKKSGIGLDVEEYISSNPLPGEDWSGWNPDVAVDDVQMVTVRNEGLNEHDFGMGWKDQLFRIKNSQIPITPIDVSEVGGASMPFSMSPEQLKKSIQSILTSYGVGYSLVNVTEDAGNRIYVNMRIR